VLDPFCGTGTTLAAALEVGCESIGIDISEGVLPEIEQRLAGVQLALPEVAAR
jgi:site-specific DNA-methyltransferase (adenine-specific)